MTWTTAQLRRLSLLVLCVMLLGALAPTVSRARAWVQGSQVSWVEVCTSAGTGRVAVDSSADGPVAPALPGMGMLDHCALCVLASDRMAPPTNPFVWKGLPQAPPLLAPVSFSFWLTTLHWAVQSRAPPALT